MKNSAFCGENSLGDACQKEGIITNKMVHRITDSFVLLYIKLTKIKLHAMGYES